ncbi:DUF3306 domain-containing protein [Bradyrhizobium sp.]|uniref:DUF3306 domain-containing protein n=1 Tax=Bradyrhizobium sp. TaxID=376 RepID=UPI001DDBA6F2|nr:DUF3306 domain-containing protein [Bradyrhizobium sp.]MBI5319658.1 DUF3306 domain-containing protein [Bradyrhizobium sp.]
MSDEEFLKRWSRRKQEAKTVDQAPLPAEAATTPPVAPPEPEVDLSQLPSLDSITAATDITGFLRKGIPAELSHAALRRAWAADPAIRDFVGLAENAWDFTDPDAIPGFGALDGTAEQIGAMVERVIGGVRETAEKLASELPEKEQVQQKPDQEPDVSASAALPHVAVSANSSPDVQAEPVVAAQPEASDEDGDVEPVRRRTHGGALPS